MANVPNEVRGIGNELATTLSGSMTSNTTSMTLADATGFSASGGYVIIDEGVVGKEEVVYIESITGNTCTISTNGRGLEGTTGVSHDVGATVTDIIVANHINGPRTAYLVEHDDAGTHKQIASAIVMSGTTASSSNKVADAGVIEPGWIPADETWVYASADAPTFTFTIAGVDKTTKYYPGMKVKLTQTTAKYFIITAVAFSTDTTITLYGGTDYVLANAAITVPTFSLGKSPAGFPLDPMKWSVSVTDVTQRAQASPVSGTWYNLGTISITIPIGIWRVNYQVAGQTNDTNSSAGEVFTTLSTANNSESDVDFTCWMFGSFGSGLAASIVHTVNRDKFLTLAAKTQYFLNTKTTTANIDNLFNRNELSKLLIKATCVYL